MGSILKVWLIFSPIFIFELQLCHIMASNANKYMITNQWGQDIIWIHVEWSIINTNPNLDLRYFIPGFLAFISIKKEAINKIQIDSRSRNDASSSGKNLLFRKLIMCWSHFTDIIMWPEKVAAPILMGHKKSGWPYLYGIWKNVISLFLVLFFSKSGRTYLNGIPKKVVAPISMEIWKSGHPFPNGNFWKVADVGFTFHKGQCAGRFYLSEWMLVTKLCV